MEKFCDALLMAVVLCAIIYIGDKANAWLEKYEQRKQNENRDE